MANSIELISSELALRVRDISDIRKRSIIVAVAQAAVDAAGLNDLAEVKQAFQGLIAERFGESPERAAMQRLVDSLDERAFDTQDRCEQGLSPEADYARAFCRARAATAVLEAFGPSVETALSNVLYEGYYAMNEDLVGLESIIESGL